MNVYKAYQRDKLIKSNRGKLWSKKGFKTWDKLMGYLFTPSLDSSMNQEYLYK